MGELTEAKPGDTLFVWTRWHKRLATVERITPTGRVVTKGGCMFNPDGYERGSRGWDRARARIATQDDIAGIHRAHLVSKIERFRRWEILSADDLKIVGEIVAAAEAKATS